MDLSRNTEGSIWNGRMIFLFCFVLFFFLNRVQNTYYDQIDRYINVDKTGEEDEAEEEEL